MNDEIMPYLINIGCVLVGIAATKVYDHFYQEWGVGKKEAALLEEMEDIRERLKEILSYYEKQLRIFALEGLEMRTLLKVSNKVFNTIYVDVAPKPNASQRRSFILTHEHVDFINTGIDQLNNYFSTTEDFTEESLEEWGEILKVNHINTAQALWHVDYHLKNKEHPLLTKGQPANYKPIDEFTDEMIARVETIIEDTKKNLSREDFEKRPTLAPKN